MPLFRFPVGEAEAFQTAALPYGGDAQPGEGMTTSAATNPNILEAYGLTYDSISQGGTNANDAYVGDGNGIYRFSDNVQVGQMLTRGMAGHPVAEHPYFALGAAAITLLVIKFWIEKGENKGEVARISVGNAFRIWLLWFGPQLILKWFFGYYYVASISGAVAYA